MTKRKHGDGGEARAKWLFAGRVTVAAAVVPVLITAIHGYWSTRQVAETERAKQAQVIRLAFFEHAVAADSTPETQERALRYLASQDEWPALKAWAGAELVPTRARVEAGTKLRVAQATQDTAAVALALASVADVDDPRLAILTEELTMARTDFDEARLTVARVGAWPELGGSTLPRLSAYHACMGACINSAEQDQADGLVLRTSEVRCTTACEAALLLEPSSE